MIVLALSPHPDDAEFGAGASIARWTRRGARVVSVAFSDCRDSPTPVGDAVAETESLRAEHASAGAVLGVETRCMGFRRRTFAEDRQEVLDEMIRLRDEIRPDVVLCPARFDVHQDHQVVSAEAVRAFRGTTTLGYILPWNCPTAAANGWRRVAEEDVEAKALAISCYVSQAGRPYARESLVWAGAEIAGLRAGCRYAEEFDVIRWIS